MKYALNLAEDGRILSATFEKFATIGSVLVDNLPDGNIADYLYQNGEYIYSPLPKEEPEEPEETTTLEDRISELEQALELILSGVTE